MATSLFAFASLLLLIVLSNPDLAAFAHIADPAAPLATCPASWATATARTTLTAAKTARMSPSVTAETPTTMTLNSFAKGGDGGGPSDCDNKYHPDDEIVVALSTGWFDGMSRCLKNIMINVNGNSVLAKVVDECDSVNGCNKDYDFQPPCANNIVDASPAVWKALGIPKEVGEHSITWSDA
uniref:Ripening-related protein 1 n=1 Tax=Ananas comosus var. bracteatus TaxID=296719 RepID=A0A6V7QBC0_ANACO|nr:unnamed protein product [Ananas comosus var. bracteatus]